MNLKELQLSISDFFESEKGKLASKLFNRVLQVVILGFLAYQLYQVGWQEFLKALPLNPLFYLIILVNYFLLPVSEIFTYKISWPISAKTGLPIFIKKRVLNKDVIGYSGEVQLFNWAQKTMGLSKKETFKVIRDNNILSSIASTVIVFGLLLTFLLTGQIDLLDYINFEHTFVYAASGLIGAIIVGVLWHYRSFFFSMPRKQASKVLSIHFSRLLMVNFFQVLMWYVALPEIPLSVWITYLSVSLIVSRFPFIPNRDFLFIGFSIEAAELLQVSSAEIAGLFITQSVVDKLLNAFFYLIFSNK